VADAIAHGMKIVIIAGASSTESKCRHQSRRRAIFEPSFFNSR
jgi:hypothetical protein